MDYRLTLASHNHGRHGQPRRPGLRPRPRPHLPQHLPRVQPYLLGPRLRLEPRLHLEPRPYVENNFQSTIKFDRFIRRFVLADSIIIGPNSVRLVRIRFVRLFVCLFVRSFVCLIFLSRDCKTLNQICRLTVSLILFPAVICDHLIKERKTAMPMPIIKCDQNQYLVANHIADLITSKL